ncbi:unnamed protein product [Polarella glacialis]|uniref:Uncharacterized protein n=1 Tax=Polarella glacialis TaxID=89957 RepID=A0A813KW68_POLGL|nr:unnamed protein product [Polarella glacialis]
MLHMACMPRASRPRTLLAIGGLLSQIASTDFLQQAWPGRAVDPLLASEQDALRALFRWHAPSGTLDEWGMKGFLDVQRRADGLPEVPLAFARSFLYQFQGRTDGSEDSFVQFYIDRFWDRKNFFNRWKLCCFQVLRSLATNPTFCQAIINLREDQLGLVCGSLDDLRHTPVELAMMEENAWLDSLEQQAPPQPPLGGFARMTGADSIGGGRAPLQKQLKGACQMQTALSCSLPDGPLAPADGGPGTWAPGAKGIQKPPTSSGRLAVLVTGLRERFYPLSTLRHVVRPAVRAGYQVDYHAMLDWERAVMQNQWGQVVHWKQGKAVEQVNSWGQAKELSKRTMGNPAFANASKEEFLDYVSRHARHYGVSKVRVRLMHPALAEDSLEAVDQRYFGEGSRYHPNFRKSRLRYKNVELLWNLTREFLRDEGGSMAEYSHVLWVRDDVHFVGDVHLRLFPEPWTVYSTPMAFPCARQEHQLGDVSDRVLLVGGRAADSFLRLHSIHRDLPSVDLDNARHPENFLYAVAKVLGLPWEVVAQDWLPSYISVHYRAAGPTTEAINNNNNLSGSAGPPTAAFCLRGLNRHLLMEPRGPCIHPAKVPYDSCPFA